MPSLPVARIERVGKKGGLIVVDAGGAGWSWDLLLRSDAHHDNPHSFTDVEKFHLDLARARGAGIIDIGDTFCAMQGPKDPRQDKAQLRKRDVRNDYFDGLVEEHAEFYGPYANLWLLQAQGNHEDSVLRHHGTDLTARFGAALKAAADGCGPLVMPYQGMFRLRFHYNQTRRQSFGFYYTHGYGGGGPVTKDLTQLNRQLVQLDNADFMLSGHTHDAWYVPFQRERLTDDGNIEEREGAAVKIGGYKNETEHGEGYAVTKGRAVKPIGGWWLHFYYGRDRIRYSIRRVEEFY